MWICYLWKHCFFYVTTTQPEANYGRPKNVQKYLQGKNINFWVWPWRLRSEHMWVRIRQQAKESGLTFGFTPSSSSSPLPPWHHQNEYTIRPEPVSYWSARHLPSALYVESLTPALPVYCVAPQKVSSSLREKSLSPWPEFSRTNQRLVSSTSAPIMHTRLAFFHMGSNRHRFFWGMVAILTSGSFLHSLV